ncbi:hypothetical protein [Pseudaestuariivita atlantica]|uniref:Uncharacterized protein n=1 Tax=Pseudaestuariivita atlantica TaxID=1317121 RepID=A0A0L1JJL6_9RHOB|nr:hypothetical protein [Pseudaestuariivita atlantica]KNG91940.1 hypothetical protein ATO11_20060 [Pseudaestuariivita atlantica]
MATEVYGRVEFGDFNHDDTETPMTETDMDLSELLAKQDGGDFLDFVFGAEETFIDTSSVHRSKRRK